MKWVVGLCSMFCLASVPCLAYAESRTKSESYIELAKILAAGDEVIVETVKSAIEAPKEYLGTDLGKSTGERLFVVEDPASSPDLPWLALLDVLLARKLAAEIDWEDGPVDVHWALEQIKPFQVLPSSLKSRVKAVRGSTFDTAILLRDIARILQREGLIVGWYRLESDSYPLIFLNQERFQEASRLATETGHSISNAALTLE